MPKFKIERITSEYVIVEVDGFQEALGVFNRDGYPDPYILDNPPRTQESVKLVITEIE